MDIVKGMLKRKNLGIITSHTSHGSLASFLFGIDPTLLTSLMAINLAGLGFIISKYIYANWWYKLFLS